MAASKDIFFMECKDSHQFDKKKLISSSMPKLMSSYERCFIMTVRVSHQDGFFVANITGKGAVSPFHIICFMTIAEFDTLFIAIQREYKISIKVAFEIDKSISDEHLTRFTSIPKQQIEMELRVRKILKETEEK